MFFKAFPESVDADTPTFQLLDQPVVEHSIVKQTAEQLAQSIIVSRERRLIAPRVYRHREQVVPGEGIALKRGTLDTDTHRVNTYC